MWQRQLPVHVADFAQVLLSLGQPLAESLTLELQPDDDAPALLGLAAGQSIDWSTGEGKALHLKVLEVTWQPEANDQFDL